MTNSELSAKNSESERDRRLGRWAIIAGLIAATVAAAAGIGGSVLGASIQSNASQDQASAEFARQQKLSAYQGFLLAMSDLGLDCYELEQHLERDPHSTEARAEVEKYRTDIQTANERVASLELFAPARLFKLANKAFEADATGCGALAGGILDSPDDSDNDFARYHKYHDPVPATMRDVIKQARADLKKS